MQPIAEIGRIAKEPKIPLHTDAVQSVCNVPIAQSDYVCSSGGDVDSLVAVLRFKFRTAFDFVDSEG